MVVPNMVMKFQNVNIFYKMCFIFDLSSAHACRVESIKTQFSKCALFELHISGGHRQWCIINYFKYGNK